MREERLEWLSQALMQLKDIATGLQQHGAKFNESNHIRQYLAIIKVHPMAICSPQRFGEKNGANYKEAPTCCLCPWDNQRDACKCQAQQEHLEELLGSFGEVAFCHFSGKRT